ncbi:MAG: Na+/H+ antiporter NhaA [Proteobacteria bacterium]|nr:MAG: Na+/H+ antiporter NhaA [Pseudomonadota bacterium]
MQTIKKFFQLEAAAGILLFITAVVAMMVANSPLDHYYDLLLDTTVMIQVGALVVNKPLLLWINDGLMVVFFFLVGLELKREVLQGELKDKRNVILPALGAVGGMLIPALIYIWFNWNNPNGLQGWAIPAATDIAFALAVLKLAGPRVPISLKLFLTSLAIFDDIGAILIIAFFYTSNLSLLSLLIVGCCIPILWLINRRGVDALSIYVALGLVMWVAMLKSGVHATLTGIILAFFIPMQSKRTPEYSPLKDMENDLHSVVAYMVLPVFAFANAGITLSGVGLAQLLHPVPLGIAVALVVGKQVGVFGFCWLAIKLNLASLPKNSTLLEIYAVACLCGIGFTMSLFIGSLAFQESQINNLFDERLGIIIGSLLAATMGYIVLKIALRRSAIVTD